MVKYLKVNLHSLFIALASVSYVSKTKQNLIANHTQQQHNLTFATEVCYSCTRYFLLGTFYSYKTARTCSEPHSVERRLFFRCRSNDNFRKLEAPDSLENHFLWPFPMVTVVMVTTY